MAMTTFYLYVTALKISQIVTTQNLIRKRTNVNLFSSRHSPQKKSQHEKKLKNICQISNKAP